MGNTPTFFKDKSQYHVQRGGLDREQVCSEVLFMNSVITSSQCRRSVLLSHYRTVTLYKVGIWQQTNKRCSTEKQCYTDSESMQNKNICLFAYDSSYAGTVSPPTKNMSNKICQSFQDQDSSRGFYTRVCCGIPHIYSPCSLAPIFLSVSRAFPLGAPITELQVTG